MTHNVLSFIDFFSTTPVSFSTMFAIVSLLSGLEGSNALVEQIAEADRVVGQKVSHSVGLSAAHALLIGSAHGLESFNLLGSHALGESIVGLNPGDVRVGHLDFSVYDNNNYFT